MHPLWQIKQVITTNFPTRDSTADANWNTSSSLVCNVDCNDKFGGHASACLWESFIGLVVWIAILKKDIHHLFCYMDNNYSWDIAGELLYYEPYNTFFPDKQTCLVLFWDELDIPHKQPKQLYREILLIIGYDVDPNNMTVSMYSNSKANLVLAVQEFIHTKSHQHTLKEFLYLQGWINWSLNAFPLLCPSLCAMYARTSGKNMPSMKVFINQTGHSPVLTLPNLGPDLT